MSAKTSTAETQMDRIEFLLSEILQELRIMRRRL